MACEVGIPLITLSEERPLFMVDGAADEIGPGLNLIKGHGGVLLRKKIVADAREFLAAVAIPWGCVRLTVEIEPFGWEVTLDALASLGCESSLRLEDPGSQTAARSVRTSPTAVTTPPLPLPLDPRPPSMKR